MHDHPLQLMPQPATTLTDLELTAELERIEGEHQLYCDAPPDVVVRHTELVRELVRRPATNLTATRIGSTMSWMLS